jgi:streptogramin lyase
MRTLKHPLRKAVGFAVVIVAWAIWAQVAAAAPLVPGQVLAGIGAGTINQFTPTGTLTGTLSNGTGSLDTGMCFTAGGDLLGTNFSNTVSRWDATGALVASAFINHGGTNESCTLDASGNIFVGDASAAAFYEFDSSGALINTFSVATEDRGTDWLDLSKDQHTMLYTSEGSSILRFDTASNTQLSDFATGLAAPCYALRIRSNGEVMVACDSTVYRLDAAGTILQTYTPSGGLFALNLDPDGTTFWTATISGTIYRIDIATGAVVTTFVSNTNTGLFGLAVVGELRAAVDTTPPMCSLTATLVGPPKEIQVTVQDTGSGLASVVPLTVNATATVPVFAPGSTSAQVVIADKTDQSQGSSLSLVVTDVSGNVTRCDPVFGTPAKHVKHHRLGRLAAG